eukprot:TRINITY_DN23838_c0_g1_i1.p1 TRINITY_DN23838_c0_g1~~TRINITY_DN23838_c0_g1_i1.p1  ORF type:complete len:916 (+),score=304.35 TRINITY_DN23838_c0_g1_i1:232-2748(+)
MDVRCGVWVVDRVLRAYNQKQLPVGPQVTSALVGNVLRRSPLQAVEILSACHEPHAVLPSVYENTLHAIMIATSLTSAQRSHAAITVNSLYGSPTSKSLNITLQICILDNDLEFCFNTLEKMEALGLPLLQSVGEKVLVFLCKRGAKEKAADVLASLAVNGGLTPAMRAAAKEHGIQESTRSIVLKVPSEKVADAQFKMSPFNPTVMDDKTLSGQLRQFQFRIKQWAKTEKGMGDAVKLFGQLKHIFETGKATGQQLGSRSYTEMLTACAFVGAHVDAVVYYEEAKAKGLVNSYVACAALAAMVTPKEVKIALSIFKEVRKMKFGDRVPYETMLRVCQAAGDVKTAEYVVEAAKDDKIGLKKPGYTALMYIYQGEGNVRAALQLHDDLYPQHYFLPSIAFPLVDLLSSKGRWGEVVRILKRINRGLKEKEPVNPRLLGLIIHFAAKYKMYAVMKEAYVIALRFRLKLEEISLRQLFDMALHAEDIVLCCKLYESINMQGSFASMRMLIVQSLCKTKTTVSFFERSVDVIRRLRKRQGASVDNIVSTIVKVLHVGCKGLARTPYITDATVYSYIMCVHYSGEMRRDDNSFTKTFLVMGTVLFLYRHNPQVLTPKVWFAVAVAWNLRHLITASAQKEVDLAPSDIVDTILTYAAKNYAAHDASHVEVAVGNSLLAIVHYKIRHLTGCYGKFYQLALVAVTQSSRRASHPSAASDDVACNELRYLLNIGSARREKEETESIEADTKPYTGFAVVPFNDMGLVRWVLELVIDELRENDGLLSSGRLPSTSLLEAIRQVPEVFPDLLNWVDAIEELCGKYAPQRAKLEDEIKRLKKLLQEKGG